MLNTSLTGARKNERGALQAYVLMALGLLLLLGAFFLHLNAFSNPVGLFTLGLGLLVSVVFNPTRLAIPGVIFTLVGAAIFIAYKPLIPYDNGLVVIVIGLALLIIALLTRRGYIGGGAASPGLLVLLVGFFLYPPTGQAATMLLAPFILSLWFPGIALFLLGLIYWFLSFRQTKRVL